MDADDRRAVEAALRDRAETELAAVEAEWGDAPRRDPLHFPARSHDPDEFPATVEEQVARLAGIAGALVTDDAGRVLCVDVTYTAPDWQTPGGAVEPGDTLPETAAHEVEEETGVEAELTGLLYTRIAEVDYGYPEVAPIPVAIFTGRRDAGTARVAGNVLPDGTPEIADVAWFDPEELPPDTLDREWILRHFRE